MANLNYSEAKIEIIKRFEKKDSVFRKIVFWYDPDAKYQDDILSDMAHDESFSFRLLIMDKNEFAIKKTIEHDDIKSNFLIYIPREKPDNSENWLLDILMYSEEYSREAADLTMTSLGLKSTELKRVIEQHQKFFDAENRVRRLSSYGTINDGMRPWELKLAMICVLAKARTPSLESVLTELVFDLYSEKTGSHSLYTELKKYGLEEYLWDEIARLYNYDGDQKIDSLIKKFLFTAFLEQAPDLKDNEFKKLPTFYEQYIVPESGALDAKFFVDNIKQDKRYFFLQGKMAEELKISELLSSMDIIKLKEADVFELTDKEIIKKISDSLLNGSLDYDTFSRVIKKRENSIWYETHKYEYFILENIINLNKALLSFAPSGLSISDYIKRYVADWYLLDGYYRHIIAFFHKLEEPVEEMERLKNLSERIYEERFLNPLGKAFSDALKAEGNWQLKGLRLSKDFFHDIERKNYKKCFVIISDGLRFEIAEELLRRMKSDSVLKGNEELSFMISPLPSETRFGMASLLPHDNISYELGKVYVDGQKSVDTASRDAVLKNKKRSYAAIRYDDISKMTRDELRSYMSEKSLVYIYHNVLDNTGEHDESRVFDAAENAMGEILSLIKKLYNSLQISNFYVTSDHGFIYRDGDVKESQKYSDIVKTQPTEVTKRYVLTDDFTLKIPYTLEFILGDISDGKYKIITPYGYDLFKSPGGGLRYVHGGASLQETVVPVIHLMELRASSLKEDIRPVGVRLKSVKRKITNRSFTLEFEQYEKVDDRKQGLTCETYIVDEDGNKVSNTYRFVASSKSDDPDERRTSIRFNLMNIDFDRSKRYYLILKDAAQTGYIEREQFVINILNLRRL